jgi:hypothetical protein
MIQLAAKLLFKYSTTHTSIKDSNKPRVSSLLQTFIFGLLTTILILPSICLSKDQGLSKDKDLSKEQEFPFLTWKILAIAPPAIRDQILDSISNVLSEIEMTSGIPYFESSTVLPKLSGKPALAESICSRAGWLFTVKKATQCTGPSLYNGCPKGSVRCALWTGSDCTIENEGHELRQCLKQSQSNLPSWPSRLERQKGSMSWNLQWFIIERACTGILKQNKECLDLKKLTLKVLENTDTDLLPIDSRLFGYHLYRQQNLNRHNCKNLLIATLYKFLIPVAEAADSCGMNENAKSFTKDSGTPLQFIWNQHLNPDEFDSLFAKLLKVKIPRENAIEAVRTFLKSNQNILEGHRNTINQISEFSKTHKDNGWIAGEASDEELNATALIKKKSDVQAYADILSALGIPNSEIEDCILLAYGPIEYIWMRRPESWGSLRIIGVERSDLRKETSEVVSLLSGSAYSELISLHKQGKLINSDAKQLFNLQELMLDENRLPTAEEKKTITTNIVDEQARQVAAKYIALLEKFIKLSSQRDEAAADRLLSEPGPGLLVMGSSHRTGVIARLESSCHTLPAPKSISHPAGSTTQSVQ